MTKLNYKPLRDALDAESYSFLNTNAPDLLVAIEGLVREGATPQDIRTEVQRAIVAERAATVARCEAAARYISTRMREV